MSSSTPPPADGGIRLQKVLAAAGFGSRRRCEALIDDARVTVDGQLVLAQGTRVTPGQVIRVDGERIAAPAGAAVFALNKPRGIITAMSDDRGRANVGELLAANRFTKNYPQLFHVGRLDADTDGLLLITNDGQLANHLTHPTSGVEKTYVATVAGKAGPNLLKQLKDGVRIDDRKVEVRRVKIRQADANRSMIELVIHEGRKHIVRRLLAEAGYPVKTLTRTKFGPVRLEGLGTGEFRRLTEAQVSALYDAGDGPGAVGSASP